MRFLMLVALAALSVTPLTACRSTTAIPSATAAAAAEPATFESATLRSRFEELARECKAPGVSACVVLPDGSHLALAAGWADPEAHVAMTPATRLLAGSVGKTFFGALALELVREGRLDLDAPIERQLGARPWFARLPNAHAITPRMLLQHTSGLVRYEFDPRFTAALAADPLRVWKPEEAIEFVLDRPAPFAAGEGWEYSDTNYLVLGLALEEITKTRAYDEIERRFLRPFALSRTLPSTSATIEGLAQGFTAVGDLVIPGGTRSGKMIEHGALVISPQFEWAGGGFASCPTDLARWMHAIQNGRVYGQTLLEEAHRVVPAPLLGPTSGYGLTTIRWETPLGPAWGHSGYFPGYLTDVRWFERSGVCVAVMVNTSDRAALSMSPGALAVELARAAIDARAR